METLRVYEAGTPMNRWARLAAAEIVRVATEISAIDGWRTTVAMFLMREHEPRRFVSDKAFLVQLSRRVRFRAGATRWTSVDPVTGAKKSTMRVLNRRAAEAMGKMLAEMFGAAGSYFADQERDERERKEAERKAFYEALRAAGAAGDVGQVECMKARHAPATGTEGYAE